MRIKIKNIQKNDIEFFKKMCVLNDTGSMFVPQILKELQTIVPSYSGTFYWLNNQGTVTNLYDPSPDAFKCAKLYINDFLDRRDIEAQPSLTQWALTNEIVTTSDKFGYKHFYQSSYYNEFLKPLNYHHKILTSIKNNDSTVGLLLLHRSEHESEFTMEDEKVMRELSPYIAYGLTKTTGVESLIAGTSEMGMLVFNHKCELQYLSPQGRKHLFYATHPAITKENLSNDKLPVVIPPEVIILCNQILMSADLTMQQPPVWQHRNNWGGFLFRAQLLENGGNTESSLVAVTVEFQEPAKYKIFRRCRELSLSPRQVEICAYLVEGKTYEDIGSKIFISTNTVIDHTRKLFDKLQVKNRSELTSKLMSD